MPQNACPRIDGARWVGLLFNSSTMIAVQVLTRAQAERNRAANGIVVGMTA
jgi:hypothetical protein